MIVEWIDWLADLRNIRSNVGLIDRLRLWWRYRPI